MKDSDSEKIGVPGLAKGFSILDLLANEPGLGFSAIQQRLGLAKSSCYLLLSTLSKLGAIQLQPDRGYVLGLRLFELGALAANQRHIEDRAMPYLRKLAQEVQLTCHLGVREGLKAVYLAKVECDREIRVNTWVGKQLSLNSSSLGKILLAWLPEGELDEILDHLRWEPKGPKAILDPGTFKNHLAEVRACGWASDDEEDARNIRCVAAPIIGARGEVVAAVSAVGTVLEVAPDQMAEIADRVQVVTRELSLDFGFRPKGRD